MLNKELISGSIPTLASEDTVSHALQLMADYHLSHLPVVEEDAFLGLVSEDELLNASDDSLSINKSAIPLAMSSVQANSHITEAVKLANDYNIAVVPVVEEKAVWVGAISRID